MSTNFTLKECADLAKFMQDCGIVFLEKDYFIREKFIQNGKSYMHKKKYLNFKKKRYGK